MPAPTALLRRPEELGEDIAVLDALQIPEEESVLLDPNAPTPALPAPTTSALTDADDSMVIDSEGRPRFAPAKESPIAVRVETRKCPVPPHRMTPLKANWARIFPPLVEHLKLQ
ncbi:hypothetical protein LTS18_001749, partial [Coniosporium uncinatum]